MPLSLSKLFPPTLHFFLPRACAGCDRSALSGEGFCDFCLPVVHRIVPPFCNRCQVPMESFPKSSVPVTASSRCSECSASPPAFQRVFALFEYDGAVADGIRRIKYGNDFPALRTLCAQARPWAREIFESLPDDPPVLPIPSHPRELRRRGFHLPSQACRLLGLPLRWPPQRSPLVKHRPSAPQASLSFAARRANVADVFRWNAPPVEGGSILLFDDVLTTGATADAAARVLLEAGFDDIFVLALARARRNF